MKMKETCASSSYECLPESAHMCLNPNARGQKRLDTPEHLRKWRKNSALEPGKRVLHPALIDDFKEMNISNTLFGVTPNDSESNIHVEDVLNTNLNNEHEKIMIEMKESIYKSAQREPLGKSFRRGHQQPDFTLDPTFRYGVTSTRSEETAKSLLSTSDEVSIGHSELEMNQKYYTKSHGSYLPGQQKERNYKWPVDPLTVVFGEKGQDLSLRRSSKGVHEALHSDMDVIEKEKRRHTIAIPSDCVFGMKTPTNIDYNGTECRLVMQGDYSQYEQAADTDLGKSTTPGFRNVITENRIFGRPTVRNDIPKYSRQSVADTQNYGDDYNAKFLINPKKYATLGVDEKDFAMTRGKEYIYNTFMNIKSFELNDHLFDQLYSSVSDNFGMASIQSFQNAYNKHINH